MNRKVMGKNLYNKPTVCQTPVKVRHIYIIIIFTIIIIIIIIIIMIITIIIIIK